MWVFGNRRAGDREGVDRVPRFPEVGRALIVGGLLLYLLEVPIARDLTAIMRGAPLFIIMLGMVILRLPQRSALEVVPRSEMVLPMLAVLASTALSVAHSTLVPLSLERALLAPVGLLMFMAVQDAIVEPRMLRRMAGLLGVVVGLLGLDGLVQFATGTTLFAGREFYAGRVVAGLPHPNDLVLIPLLLPFVLVRVLERDRLVFRIALALAIILGITTAILSQSRNAWIGLALAFGSFVTLGERRPAVFAGIGFAVLFFGAAFFFDVANLQHRVATLADLSREGRIGIWITAWAMFLDHPWLGIGPHVFGEHYLSYLRHVSLPPGYRPEVTPIPWAHNIYLELLAERGILGLLSFGAVVAAIALRCTRTLQRRGRLRGPRSATERYAVALAASGLTFMGMALFDLTFSKDWVWLYFCLVSGVAARFSLLASAESTQEGSPESAA